MTDQVQKLRASEVQSIVLTSRFILLPKATGELSKDLPKNDTRKHFKCPGATVVSMIWWLTQQELSKVKNIFISTKTEPQIFTILLPKPEALWEISGTVRNRNLLQLGCLESTPGCLPPWCTQFMQEARLSMQITAPWLWAGPVEEKVPRGLLCLAWPT